jgi:DNA-binding NarL/FixJ family response regulator
MSPRCLIVDDNAAFVSAARALLEMEGVTVVGVASSAAEALGQVEELSPDVTLVDIDLGQESGLELARKLKDDHVRGRSQVILISAHDETDFLDLIAESPVAGFVAKSKLSARAIAELLDYGRDLE